MKFWWHLSGEVPWELEESLSWRLASAGANRAGFGRQAQSSGELSLHVWLPEELWLEGRRQELVEVEELEQLWVLFSLPTPDSPPALAKDPRGGLGIAMEDTLGAGSFW